METQIGFMLGGCVGEGVTTGINLSSPGDEQGATGEDAGEAEEQGGITPGEGTKALEGDPEDDAGNTLQYDAKIRQQMGPRGWTEDSIDNTVEHPAETHPVWDYTTG